MHNFTHICCQFHLKFQLTYSQCTAMFSVILIDYLECNYDGFSGGTSVYLCTATAIMCHTLFYDCVGVAVRTLLLLPCVWARYRGPFKEAVCSYQSRIVSTWLGEFVSAYLGLVWVLLFWIVVYTGCLNPTLVQQNHIT